MTAEPSMEIRYIRPDGTLTYEGMALLQELAEDAVGLASWGTITGTLSAQADLNAALAGKAASVHTHVAANVTDFSEAVDDRVAALVVSGLNIAITYDDVAGTLTFDAAGGGGATATGSAVLDFGSAPGTNNVEVTVSTPIPAGASVRAWFQSEASADHNEIEHRLIFPSRVGLTCGAITDGVGFTIYSETELRLTGDVACRWAWSA